MSGTIPRRVMAPFLAVLLGSAMLVLLDAFAAPTIAAQELNGPPVLLQIVAKVGVGGSWSGSVAAGYLNGCAIYAQGGVKCWGHNGKGALANGLSGDMALAPMAVIGLGGGLRAFDAPE